MIIEDYWRQIDIEKKHSFSPNIITNRFERLFKIIFNIFNVFLILSKNPHEFSQVLYNYCV
jgi:hypothetical protein